MQKKISSFLTCCHWNINRIAAHKLTMLTAHYIILIHVMHKYNVVWILQTFLDSAVQDNDLSISEYDSIRADHSNNVSHNVCFVRLKGEIM